MFSTGSPCTSDPRSRTWVGSACPRGGSVVPGPSEDLARSSEFLGGYAETGGAGDIDVAELRWAIIAGTWVWAVGCMQQAERHRSGATRSIDLAAVGRRVVENEADLLTLIAPDVRPPAESLAPGTASLSDTLGFGPPTLTELLDAVAGEIEADLLLSTAGRTNYVLRVSRNAIRMSIRELLLADRIAAADADRRAAAGIELDDRRLAAMLRTDSACASAAVIAVLVAHTADLLEVVDPARAAAYRRQAGSQ